MSTRVFEGSARLTYTPAGGSETTILLAVKLGIMREFTPSRVVSTYDWWTEDNLERKVVTIGTGVREVVFGIRFDNEPVSIMAMLEDAMVNNTTITYTPVESGNTYPHKVVEIIGSPIGSTTIQQDRQRWGAGEWEVMWRARRVDGGSFDLLIASNT